MQRYYQAAIDILFVRNSVVICNNKNFFWKYQINTYNFAVLKITHMSFRAIYISKTWRSSNALRGSML
ncbi:MAG TPA: hypothetical protein DCL43_05585 [Chitinophagaceae bacterium]|nr:hypothetical protein [Chitinophagaceae bacterium]HAN39615.1 hypothetical protein [Chitinophagaceae bacterium]